MLLPRRRGASTASLALALLLSSTHLAAAISCPKWLEPFCESACIVKHCGQEMAVCLEDAVCRRRLMGIVGCMGGSRNQTTDPLFPDDCLVPDNALVDDFLYCSMQEHQCAPAFTPAPVYPDCQDATLVKNGTVGLGDPRFTGLAELAGGTWYKIHGWKIGEPLECQPCQTVRFEPGTDGDDDGGSGSYEFLSNWTMPNTEGEMFNMTAGAKIAPRGGGLPPSKLVNEGRMFGLNFHEPYTVLDHEANGPNPFAFLYTCGSTLQGNYSAALVLGRRPGGLSPATRDRLATAAAQNGLDFDDFCDVDNSCFEV